MDPAGFSIAKLPSRQQTKATSKQHLPTRLAQRSGANTTRTIPVLATILFPRKTDADEVMPSGFKNDLPEEARFTHEKLEQTGARKLKVSRNLPFSTKMIASLIHVDPRKESWLYRCSRYALRLLSTPHWLNSAREHKTSFPVEVIS